MKKQRSIIGILGGMGPQASAKLVQILVDLSSREFGARNCEDFPEIVLDSFPHPDFISDKKNKPVALKILKTRVKRMKVMHCGMFAIACNTAHILLNQFQKASKVPFVSMIDEIAKRIDEEKIIKVGLLTSPTTLKSGLFQKAIGPGRSVWPERQVYCGATDLSD